MRPRRNRSLAATAAFFVACALVPTSPAVAAAAVCPVITAHKAGGLFAPENTVAGIRASADQGATMVEMDVRWSDGENTSAKPGYPVLMHDPTVDRTTPGTGNVADLSFTVLTGLAANDYAPWKTDPKYTGANTPKVPYAWDFMDTAHDENLTALLDVKVTPGQYMAAKLYEYIDRTDMLARTIYMGSVASVQAMRGRYPGLKYAVIEYPPAGRLFTGEYLKGLGAGAYAVPWDRISPAMVAYYHSYGLDVYTWTSDTTTVDVPARWSQVTNAGVDVLITNRPADAIGALGC